MCAVAVMDIFPWRKAQSLVSSPLGWAFIDGLVRERGHGLAHTDSSGAWDRSGFMYGTILRIAVSTTVSASIAAARRSAGAERGANKDSFTWSTPECAITTHRPQQDRLAASPFYRSSHLAVV